MITSTAWYNPNEIKLYLILVQKFSSIYLTKVEKRLVFRLPFVNLQCATDGIHIFDAKYKYVFVV